jgi:hypothetical protein
MSRAISAITILAVTAVLLNCTKESQFNPTTPYTGLVDARLIPYFNAFTDEAALRGVHVSFVDFPITGNLREIAEDNIAGTCNYHSYDPNVVTIDLAYWNSSSNLGREMVVFHELGHCYLGRKHLETAFSNGVCASIMNSGTSGCVLAYTAANRDYYLDELFAGAGPE